MFGLTYGAEPNIGFTICRLLREVGKKQRREWQDQTGATTGTFATLPRISPVLTTIEGQSMRCNFSWLLLIRNLNLSALNLT